MIRNVCKTYYYLRILVELLYLYNHNISLNYFSIRKNENQLFSKNKSKRKTACLLFTGYQPVIPLRSTPSIRVR
ncbi:MAG: hypothetical protein J5793_04030 [Clostridia bacterium]|nr:hypothetical protein [Clostridia bacterium]